eukprot:snap_masked-scaffold_71-processed-gene-0.29-mRNA-1 protein AED:1.00 eAED:1.00 QI:0/-1/0/0/-1/1/1/0/62
MSSEVVALTKKPTKTVAPSRMRTKLSATNSVARQIGTSAKKSNALTLPSPNPSFSIIIVCVL